MLIVRTGQTNNRRKTVFRKNSWNRLNRSVKTFLDAILNACGGAGVGDEPPEVSEMERGRCGGLEPGGSASFRMTRPARALPEADPLGSNPSHLPLSIPLTSVGSSPTPAPRSEVFRSFRRNRKRNCTKNFHVN